MYFCGVNECIVEQAEALIVAVVQQLLEFAVSYLEKSEFNGDDLSIQVCVASLAIYYFNCRVVASFRDFCAAVFYLFICGLVYVKLEWTPF